MQDIKDEYKAKVNLLWNHIESQADELQRIIDGMEKEAGLFSEADYARAVETVGTELKEYSVDLQTLSREYQDYLKAEDRKDNEENRLKDAIDATESTGV